MKKLGLLLFSLFCGVAAFAQEAKEADVFNSEKYQTFRTYYMERIDNGTDQKAEVALKAFLGNVRLDGFFDTLRQLGHKNFSNAGEKQVGDYYRWLDENLQKTKFATAEEAKRSLDHCMQLLKEAREQSEKMAPLFDELTREIGYSALFRKLSEDYEAHNARL